MIEHGVNCGQTRWQNCREQSLPKGRNKFWDNVKPNKTHLGGSVGPIDDQLLTPDLAGEAKTRMENVGLTFIKIKIAYKF